MIFFHVDKREFNAGDEVRPESTTYEASLIAEKKEVEEMLNETSFISCRRSDHVFLFDQLSHALCYAGKVKGHVYQVTFEHKEMKHRADMNKLDNILDVFRYTDNPDIRKTVTNEYWKTGTHTFAPCYEYLVKKCTVVREVCSMDDVKSIYYQLISDGLPIEQIIRYREILNEVY